MKPFSKGFGLGCLTSIGLTVALPLFIAVLAGIASLMNSDVKKNSVLEIDLSGEFNEVVTTSPMALFTGQTGPRSLYDVVDAIKKAKDDKNIKGIYIKAGALACDFATLQELRRSLGDFKTSGKWIVTYGDTYTQGAYYVCSVADSLLLNPQGMIDWHGIAARPMFLADLLKKAGIDIQVSKVGRYKSAPEMFTANDMSENNRYQTEVYINSLWSTIVEDVANSRQLTADTLRALAAEMIMFSKTASDCVDLGLIDGVAYEDDLTAIMRSRLGINDEEKVPATPLSAFIPKEKTPVTGKRIVVYCAQGDIVESPSPNSDSPEIAGEVVSADLDKLAANDDVKAVVLRVNSGGGSAYASEQMWNSVRRLKAKKPVIVSMGGMAASGGYYMSCGADSIFAERTTLTGSIGIFGIIPNAAPLLKEKLGVGFATVQTNEHAAGITLTEPLTADELATMNGYIERGYDLFLSRVAEGRGMTTAAVDSIAEGRVWTGADALGIGLVDHIGGLSDAIACAARMAEMDGEPQIDYQPTAKDWFSNLLNMDQPRPLLPQSALPASLRQPIQTIQNIERWKGVQARMPFIMEMR